MDKYTGNEIVDQMATINISGNIIPITWYSTITYNNGKPHLNAITVLADIVYWYRPTEVRDECTGQLIGHRKKFAGDRLQRNYQQISDMFGLSKDQAIAAIDKLKDIGVIKKVFKNIVVGGARLNNVMYLDLVPDRLIQLTYPGKPQYLSVSDYNRIGTPLGLDRVSHYNQIGIPLGLDTNTKITTQTTCMDYINPILSRPNIDKIQAQLDYAALCSDYPHRIDMIDGIINIIVDILLLDDTAKIQINRQQILGIKIKTKYQQLNMLDVQYVIDSINNTTNKITNMRTYIITSLYNAPDTRGAYMHNWVQSDRANMLTNKII